MTGIIYRLAGTTATEAQYYTYDYLVDDVEILSVVSQAEDQRTLLELQQEVKKPLKERCVHISAFLEHDEIDKAIGIYNWFGGKACDIWNKVQVVAERVKLGSSVAGMGIFGVCLWQSVSKRSKLWAVGTTIFSLVMLSFHGSAIALEKTAIRNRNDFNAIDLIMKIALFRKDILENGLDRFSDAMNSPVPWRMRNRNFMECFTDKEITMLLTSWVKVVEGRFHEFTAFGQFILEHNLFVDVFDKLSEKTTLKPIHKAILACEGFKKSLDTETREQELEKSYDNIKNKFTDLFNTHLKDDKSQTFLKILKDRFKTAIASPNYMEDSMHHYGVGFLFWDQLDLLITNPMAVTTTMKADFTSADSAFQKYKNAIMSEQFRSIFQTIFRADKMENNDKFVVWAREQFEKLPENAFSKQFLLRQVPKKQ